MLSAEINDIMEERIDFGITDGKEYALISKPNYSLISKLKTAANLKEAASTVCRFYPGQCCWNPRVVRVCRDGSQREEMKR
ncbi:unnamed protein product [Acanthoscelides obtectus]|uniref:Uncharacterized protein n=1 Tax=Acanthoscelides obtectus TaxID=200917 RepID=A0A9P0PSK1_ACAOB|nr:unnamed protein product [Acanthoscelides obtectus]CAK1679901.1 hypothetical protein AOBTE_LOCUS32450 [Acanthoscelides obtectus]